MMIGRSEFHEQNAVFFFIFFSFFGSQIFLGVSKWGVTPPRADKTLPLRRSGHCLGSAIVIGASRSCNTGYFKFVYGCECSHRADKYPRNSLSKLPDFQTKWERINFLICSDCSMVRLRRQQVSWSYMAKRKSYSCWLYFSSHAVNNGDLNAGKPTWYILG